MIDLTREQRGEAIAEAMAADFEKASVEFARRQLAAQEHALARIRLGLETGRWEFVRDAYGILDGVVNGAQEKPEPIILPKEIRHMQRAV